MAEPVNCEKCGALTFDCPCHACAKCDGMLCATCPIVRLPIQYEYETAFGVYPSIRRDDPLPRHGGPRRCDREKPIDPVEVVDESGFHRFYGSEQLVWDDARTVVGALWQVFGFAAAGVVAVTCAVVLAAAVVIAGEVPE